MRSPRGIAIVTAGVPGAFIPRGECGCSKARRKEPAMKPSTPKTELQPSTQLRKVVFGGSLTCERIFHDSTQARLRCGGENRWHPFFGRSPLAARHQERSVALRKLVQRNRAERCVAQMVQS